MIADPKRWFDADDPELSAAIGAARRRVPSRDRMSAMAARLAQAGVTLPPELRPELSASEMPAGASASGVLSKGFVVALGVGGVALVGVLAAIGFRAEAPAATAVPPAPAPAVRVEAPTPAARKTTQAAGTSATPPLVPITEATQPALRGETVAKAAPSVARKAPDDPLPSEIDLLKRARSALAAEPSVSLSMVERARQHFPKSGFGQEREFIAISALYKLGRRSEAAARERAFRERHPRSAYLPQLDRLSGVP